MPTRTQLDELILFRSEHTSNVGFMRILGLYFLTSAIRKSTFFLMKMSICFLKMDFTSVSLLQLRYEGV